MEVEFLRKINNNNNNTMAKKDEVKKIEEGVVKETPKKDDVVEIKREDLNNLISKLDKLSKDQELLFKAADKNRLAKAQDLEGENLIKQCKISTWADTGKLIIGWKLITNKVEIVMGRWMEDQSVVIVLDGGETMTVPLLEFYRNILIKEEADIIARTEKVDDNKKKAIFFTLQLNSGRELEINSVFIN